MAENSRIYICKNRAYGEFHHSSFLSGKKVAAAGEIKIEKGIIKLVTDESGHYKPSITKVEKNLLDELSNRYYFVAGDNTIENIKFIPGF